MKVHILEGRVRRGPDDDLFKLTSCGLTIGTSETTVGRALILANQRVDEVTCKRCLAKYANLAKETKAAAR